MTALWNCHFLVREGSLGAEMLGLLSVLVRQAGFSPSMSSDGTWNRLRAQFTAFAECLAAEYLFALDDEALEAVLDSYCVHRRVAVGRLPPFLGWLNAAPMASSLAKHLNDAAQVVAGVVTVEHGYVVVTLSERVARIGTDCE